MITAKITTIGKRFLNLVLIDENEEVVSQGYVTDIDYEITVKKVMLFTYVNTEYFNFSYSVDKLIYDGLEILPYSQPGKIEEPDDTLTDEWVYPDSEAIYKYMYLKEEKTLRIAFNTSKNHVWRYTGMDYETYKEFHNYESKGRYYTFWIRGNKSYISEME